MLTHTGFHHHLIFILKPLAEAFTKPVMFPCWSLLWVTSARAVSSTPASDSSFFYIGHLILSQFQAFQPKPQMLSSLKKKKRQKTPKTQATSRQFSELVRTNACFMLFVTLIIGCSVKSCSRHIKKKQYIFILHSPPNSLFLMKTCLQPEKPTFSTL